jgi:hypothetical protein
MNNNEQHSKTDECSFQESSVKSSTLTLHVTVFPSTHKDLSIEQGIFAWSQVSADLRFPLLLR